MDSCNLPAACRPFYFPTLTLLLLLSATPAHAGKVVLTNEDQITGTITRQDEAGVTLEHPDLGTLELSPDEIESVTLTKKDPIYVHVVPDFFFGWKKTLAAGVTGSDGNSDTFSAYAEFKTGYEDDRDRWKMHANFFYGEDDGENTRNQYEAGVTKDWLVPGSREFYWANLLHEYDRFTGWQERTSGFAGIGYAFIDRSDYEMLGRAGAGGNYEAGQVNEFTPELFLGLTGEWTISENATFNWYTTFFPSLDPVFEEFRNVSGLAYKVSVDAARGMSLKLGVENQYNSEVAEDTKRNDLKYYAALVLDF